MRLHAFIISNTPMNSLGWASAGGPEIVSQRQLEALGVLFQADDPIGYVDTMMKAMVPNAHAAFGGV